MSAVQAAITRPTSGHLNAVQPGVSEAAIRISGKIWNFTVAEAQISATWLNRISDPISRLQSTFDECHDADWDSEGARPVSSAALFEAQSLLLLLPWSVPIPEFVPERCGRIAFEWYISPERVYLLSVGGTGELEFAGLFGLGNEIHGKCNFSGSLPRLVADHLRALFGV